MNAVSQYLRKQTYNTPELKMIW